MSLSINYNRGAPDGVVSGRVLEAFATAVERMTLVAQVGNMERGIAAADARVVGAVAAWRERCIAAVEAVPPHRWADGSDQWGNPCPAKIVATRADYVAAIRGA